MHLLTGIRHPGADFVSQRVGRYERLRYPPILAIAGLVGVAAGIGWLLRRRTDYDLEGRVVLVTGGTRGLGLLLAREFGERGARVAICGRSENDLAEATEALSRAGIQALGITCDVADEGRVQAMIDQVVEVYGGLDVLVNNAGIIQVGPIETMAKDDFDKALDIMFWGVVHPTMAALPHILKRGEGRIVNITSIGGKVSVPHLLPYNSAKFAAVGFSEGLGAEIQGSGVKVVTVVPGLMRTGSFMGAEFRGDQENEASLFATLSSLPLVTMDAERAARQVVDATRRGDAEVVLSLPAKLDMWTHGLAPGLTIRSMGLANRWLLPKGASRRGVTGEEVREDLASGIVGAATTWGRSAHERFQEEPRRATED